MKNIGRSWPRYCCVPAFVNFTILYFTCIKMSHSDLAKSLNTHVIANGDNPYNLPITNNPKKSGVTMDDAERLIPYLLSVLCKGFFFRYVPFNTVAFGAYNELLIEATDLGAIVGIGFNHGKLFNSHCNSFHLSRAVPHHSSNEQLTLYDDTFDPSSVNVFNWRDLEIAVYDVNNGFWIIGPLKSMNISYALPWNGYLDLDLCPENSNRKETLPCF